MKGVATDCWGQVRVVDNFNEGNDETEVILACEGHFDKVKFGYRAKYHPEPKS